MRRFTESLVHAPDTATVEELRRFQLHLVDSGTSPVSRNCSNPSGLLGLALPRLCDLVALATPI